jgi:hypothetical protein
VNKKSSTNQAPILQDSLLELTNQLDTQNISIENLDFEQCRNGEAHENRLFSNLNFSHRPKYINDFIVASRLPSIEEYFPGKQDMQLSGFVAPV